MTQSPLKGIRVIDLGQWLATPFATMLLADMGAEIIKVEPQAGDPWRSFASYSFVAVNRNKKSMVLDLTKGEDREILLKLVEKSDVFVENFRPDVPRKLGITYDDLKKYNPKLIYGSIKGYGKGPYHDWPATDPAIQALSGFMSLTGEADRPPVRSLVAIFDMTSGIYLAMAIITALMSREKTGRGEFIEVSLLDVAASMVANYWLNYYIIYRKLPKPMGSSHPTIAPYRAYRAKDGWIFIGVISESNWKTFCETLGLNNLLDDQRFNTNEKRAANREILDEIIEKEIARWDEKSLINELLLKGGVSCVPVNTIDKIVEDPHLIGRGTLVEMDHPDFGKIKVARTPLMLSDGFIGEITCRAPRLGEHKSEILKEFS